MSARSAPALSRPARHLGASALLFAASGTLTALWCTDMAEMAGMAMPGGWTMSMTWMRTPGQTWPGAAASFLGMWVVMMTAMMLPPLVPMLVGYRTAVAVPPAPILEHFRPPRTTATGAARQTGGRARSGRRSRTSRTPSG